MKEIKRVVAGDTIKVTWIDSGVTPSTIYTAVYNGNEVLVDSSAMTSSGNGHYYYQHTTPNSPGYYAVHVEATVSGKPFKRRMKYQAVLFEVD